MAIDWDDRPDTPRLRNKCQLVRTPRGGKIQAVIISTAAQAVWTHYYGGRTQPCSGADCEMCEAQGTRRRHVYVAIWNPDTAKTVMLEVTDTAGVELLLWKQEGRPLRGRMIRTVRLNSRVNAPVEVTIGDDVSAKYQLPPEPEIRDSLRIIWHLAHDPSAYTDAEQGTRVRPHIRRKKATNGANQQEPDQANGLQQPGRLGGTNGVHLEAQSNGRFSPRSTSESTFD